MANAPHMGPLSGIRIVDLTAMISGPLATMILGDQGADVIKVEPPGMGDPMRMFGAMRGGMASGYVNCNRSKRGVVFNLRTDDGKAALKKLVGDADVFVQNFRPGVIDRMGFGYEAVKAIAPNIIYVSIYGFGPTGPFSDRPVYDNIIQGITGMPVVQADADTQVPELVKNLSLDKSTAYTVAQAITAALFARERGSGGQHVQVAMLDVGLAFLWPDGMMNHTFLGDDVMTIPPFGVIYCAYPTADGYMTVSAITDEQWQNACRAMDNEEAITDPRYATIFDRMSHMDDLRAGLREGLLTRTTAEWCTTFEQHDVPHAPIIALEEVHEHPQVLANGALVETEHPTAGRMREPLPAAKFAATPGQVQGHSPALGEHTDAVLAELGYTAETIAALREDGCVA